MKEFLHVPVMVGLVAGALGVRPGGRFVDGTLGGGGHAQAILKESSPDGWLGGCDRDTEALAAATAKLDGYPGRWEVRHGAFEDLGEWVEHGSVDGVLLDLGVSSPQLDWPERGFSFAADGPLDMRMDTRQKMTAADLVNTMGEENLANLFWTMGGERQSRRIARALVDERGKKPLETTGQLAAVAERVVRRKGGRLHPATRVFQALRVAVNDEMGGLRRGLPVMVDLLKPGGRLVTITFQGLEAKMVKDFGDEMAKREKPVLRWERRKSLKPDAEELAANPRSRSAQLRILEKI